MVITYGSGSGEPRQVHIPLRTGSTYILPLLPQPPFGLSMVTTWPAGTGAPMQIHCAAAADGPSACAGTASNARIPSITANAATSRRIKEHLFLVLNNGSSRYPRFLMLGYRRS